VKQRRLCPAGHVFFKTSGCRSCPKCEASKKPATGFMVDLAAPARRALTAAGLLTVESLARRTESQVMALHGMGPNALARLQASLKRAGLEFAKAEQ
jgi:predicted RecB family nuclease